MWFSEGKKKRTLIIKSTNVILVMINLAGGEHSLKSL